MSEPVEPTETPSATPTAGVASVVISAEAITIRSRENSMDGFSYFVPTADTVDALSTVFGEAPTEGVWAGGIESYPGVTYTWPGFEIIDSDVPTVPEEQPEYRVSVTAGELNGVVLEAVDGVQVGDSAADLEAAYPDQATRVSVNGGAERLDVWLGAINVAQPPVDSETDLQRTFSVRVSAATPSGPIDTIDAPTPNFRV
ncbi:hypothetical protein [Cryobacterium sp. AP23]